MTSCCHLRLIWRTSCCLRLDRLRLELEVRSECAADDGGSACHLPTRRIVKPQLAALYVVSGVVGGCWAPAYAMRLQSARRLTPRWQAAAGFAADVRFEILQPLHLTVLNPPNSWRQR